MIELINQSDYINKIQSYQCEVNVALEKILKHYNVVPNEIGSNIDDISKIRDAIYDLNKDNAIMINCFSIIAPHTHWEKNNAIIYFYDKENSRYVIGHHLISYDTYYYPCSFVFSKNGPIPYEWIDSSSTFIQENDLLLCHKTIEKLNSLFRSKFIPLGVAIDFRFKHRLYETSIPTIEAPIANRDDKYWGFSYIYKDERNIEDISDPNTQFQQVAWHSISDKVYNLESNETEILNQLRQEFSNLNYYEKLKLLTNIRIDLPVSNIYNKLSR